MASPNSTLHDLFGGAAVHCETPEGEAARSTDSNSWIMNMAMVILTMQAGFAMLEAGMITTRHAANSLSGDRCGVYCRCTPLCQTHPADLALKFPNPNLSSPPPHLNPPPHPPPPHPKS